MPVGQREAEWWSAQQDVPASSDKPSGHLGRAGPRESGIPSAGLTSGLTSPFPILQMTTQTQKET